MKPFVCEFTFTGLSSQGSCFITIGTGKIRGKPSSVVVCSQKKRYFGTSVTNALEKIAAKLYNDIKSERFAQAYPDSQEVIQLLRTTWSSIRNPMKVGDLYGEGKVGWVEHYPAGSGLTPWDSFREVDFDSKGSPVWSTVLSKDAAAEKFGSDLILAAAEAQIKKKTDSMSRGFR